MSTVRSIFYNTVFLGSAEIVSKILQFCIMLFAARMLTLESYGVFNFAIALSFIAIVFSDFGINNLLILEISREKEKTTHYFFTAFFVKLTLSLLTLVGVWIFLQGFSYDSTSITVALIIVAFGIISSFTDLFYSIFRAHERMGFDASLKIIRMVVLSTLSLYVLFFKTDIVLFSLMFLITEVIVFIIAAVLAKKLFIGKIHIPSLEFSRALLIRAMPFGLSLVFGTLYFYIDIIMLSIFKGAVSVGHYSAAYNIALALLFIPTVYTTAIYPVLSRYFIGSLAKVKLLYKRSVKYLILIGMPISFGLFLLAKPITIFLYGDAFTPSIIVLEIIAIFVMIKFLNFLFGIVLTSINQQSKRMLCQIGTAVLNIVLNLFLIPPLGILGAAIATLLTEFFLFGIYYFFVSKKLTFYFFGAELVKPLFACGVMTAFILFAPIPLIPLIITSGGLYLVVLTLLKTFDAQDKKFIHTIRNNGSL